MSITQAKVAIITVTFNSSRFIGNYLRALAEHMGDIHYELIIVDNASTDDTIKRINEFNRAYSPKHPSIQPLDAATHIIALSENVGFGRGCNKGIEAATNRGATHLWFLNPDTEILPSSAKQLLATFNTDKPVDFAGSILTDEKQRVRAGAFRFPTISNICLSTLRLGVLDRLFSKHTTAINIEDQPYPADWLTGASFMSTTKAINVLKGFDPNYFLYFEEVDLFYRAKTLGLSVWCVPDSKVFHISGASTGINQQQTLARRAKRQPTYWFESRRYFYMKNYGRVYFMTVDICQVACLLFWKLRTQLQNKHDDTPAFLLRDIIKHSYLLRPFFKKLSPDKRWPADKK